jgi:cobalt-zinc-cadmium efflux system membrane fusion protein
MKIVCDNCATKYQIADEKVSGKAFKIRCKKCSHIIVVNKGGGEASSAGQQVPDGAAAQEAPAAAAEPAAGTDSVWHLVIDREQVGPMTADEVRGKVKAGQALLELSSPTVGQIQADALKAQQDLSLAQKAIERGRKLMADGAISTKELAQIEADFRKATSDVARTAAQLRALGVSPSEPAVSASLRARVDGLVVERSVLVGQEVRADSTDPLLTISDLSTVWVLADAYEQDLSFVQVGAAVNVRVPAYPGETFAGKVVHVHDTVDPDTRTVKLRCVVPNPGGRLKPEMFAKVELSSQGGPKAIALPSSAVLNDGDQSVVMVVNEDHSFQSAKVEVGPEQNGKVRILSGLVPGQRVVTQGALFLQREQASQ